MNVSSVHPMPHLGRRKTSPKAAAFTLVEVLVSLVVLTILLLVSAEVIGQVQNTWAQSNARVNQFREARTAFDIITRNLSQATLNTYIDYDKNYLKGGATTAVNAAAVAPSKYERKSDLQFRCGPATLLLNNGKDTAVGHAVFFQAPLGVSHAADLVGLDRLLCGRGYFVQYSSDEFFKPEFITQVAPRFRYRLMEFSPPAEKDLIYSSRNADGQGDINRWYADAGIPLKVENRDKESQNPENISLNRPVADNILTLIISPQTETGANADKTAIAPDYNYDSTQLGKTGAGTLSSQGTQHMLPPLVRVVLVAVDERSYERLVGLDTTGTPPDNLSEALQKFSTAANLDNELEELEKVLRQKKLNYRVFSATIQLRGSKWST